MEELRVLLRNKDKINPTSAQDYIQTGGYEALRKALSMDGQEIIDVLKAAGLRGRGGAGFPSHMKLQFAKNAENDVKYVVCNADEGEPGTNKDRVLLSCDPNSIFEGMAVNDDPLCKTLASGSADIILMHDLQHRRTH